MLRMWYSNITIRFRPDVGRGKSRTLKKKNLRVVKFATEGFFVYRTYTAVVKPIIYFCNTFDWVSRWIACFTVVSVLCLKGEPGP